MRLPRPRPLNRSLDKTPSLSTTPSSTQRALRGYYDDAAQAAAGEQLFQKLDLGKDANAGERQLSELKRQDTDGDSLGRASRSQDAERLKDKVPVLGDLPLVGRYFRSEKALESDEKSPKNLGEELKEVAQVARADSAGAYSATVAGIGDVDALRSMSEVQLDKKELALDKLAEVEPGAVPAPKSRVEIALPEQAREENVALTSESFGARVASAAAESKTHYNITEVAPNKSIERSEPLAARGDTVAPTLELESLRKLDNSGIETQAKYQELVTLYSRLTNLSSADFKKAIQTASPDPLLANLAEKLSEAEMKLDAVNQNLGREHAETRKLRRVVEQTNKEFEDRRDGILKGLKARLESEQKRLAESSAPQVTDEDRAKRQATSAPVPQPEVTAIHNPFSTFSLNVSDVSFKLAAASLEKGQMPEPTTVRSEEFINAFDYRDPEPTSGAPIAFAWERARYPFTHNRDLLRFSVKTAAAGRQPGRPLNLVLLLDNSGSMERADRIRIIREALRVLAGQLQPQDKISVITFARTARLWVDGAPGNQAGQFFEQVGSLTPEGGTNLEEAMNLAYQTALRHYLANAVNRVVILTDGAANLGNVAPDALKQKVEGHRKQGIALDCFGIGWEGFNDDLLEVLSRNGDGRYGFINSPEEAATEFAGQLAGALKVAASDVKVQVEFNPKRVTAYRQIGYAKHQLTKEQFRDNTVDAAEIAAQEAGNALYTVEVNPGGEGPLCTVRCRFKIPGTSDYHEHSWDVPFTGNAMTLEQSSHAMRLAATASAFSEWLVSSPFAAEVIPDRLLGYLRGVPETCGADERPKKLEWMIRQAKSIAGK
jgi:Mg-chelatase subunit ChlD